MKVTVNTGSVFGEYRFVTKRSLTLALGMLAMIGGAGLTEVALATTTHAHSTMDEYFELKEIHKEVFEPIMEGPNRGKLAKIASSSESVMDDGYLDFPPLPALPSVREETPTDPIQALDRIINFGQKIWDIAKDNRPVVEAASAFATALPRGITASSELSGWQIPRSRSYRVTYKNGFGMPVVDFRYRFTAQYGGSQNGRGRYIARGSLNTESLRVSWGYKFKSHVEIADPLMVGAAENPIAGLQVDVKWSVENIFKHQTQSQAHFIQGDGRFRVIQE